MSDTGGEYEKQKVLKKCRLKRTTKVEIFLRVVGLVKKGRQGEAGRWKRMPLLRGRW